jgi:hypothetical protein
LGALPKRKRDAVEKELEKSLPAGTNKRVKQAALNALHKEQCLEQQREWLINGNADTSKGALMQKNTDLSGCFTAPTPKRCLNTDMVVMSMGNYVMVTRDKRPNMNSEGGSGRITAVEGDGEHRTCAVLYSLTHRTEKGTPFTRLTSTPMPFHAESTPTRPGNKTAMVTPASSAGVLALGTKVSVVDRCYDARSTVKHRKIGWLLRDDAKAEGKTLTTQEKRDRTLECWGMMVNYKAGLADGRGLIKGSKEHKCFHVHNIKGKDGKFKPRKLTAKGAADKVPGDPLSMQFLCYAMGNKSRSSLIKWVASNGVDGRSRARDKAKGLIGTAGLSVIENHEWASTFFTPKRVHVEEAVKTFGDNNEFFANVKDVGAERHRKGVEWETVASKNPATVLLWNARRRNHLELQRGIKSDLIDQLLANACTSCEGLAAAVNYWCGKTAIRKWLESHDACSMHRKEIKPGLTAGIAFLYFVFLFL